MAIGNHFLENLSVFQTGNDFHVGVPYQDFRTSQMFGCVFVQFWFHIFGQFSESILVTHTYTPTYLRVILYKGGDS